LPALFGDRRDSCVRAHGVVVSLRKGPRGLGSSHSLVDVIVDLGDAAFQISDMVKQLFTDLRTSALQSLLLRYAHLKQLVARGGQLL
jgi:hypothetical protein